MTTHVECKCGEKVDVSHLLQKQEKMIQYLQQQLSAYTDILSPPALGRPKHASQPDQTPLRLDDTTKVKVSTFAGGAGREPGYIDGELMKACFKNPYRVAVDIKHDVLYVSDHGNNKIRKIENGNVTTFADVNKPYGIAVDINGNVFVADYANHKIEKITPEGKMSTFAGSSKGDLDGEGTQAKFDHPYGLAADGQGNIYVSDYDNHKIKKISPEGIVSTVAGGVQGYADGPSGDKVMFNYPRGLAVDAKGNIFVADNNNFCVRKIATDGSVSTLSGNSKQGYQDGEKDNASFYNIEGIAVDNDGNVYAACFRDPRIRKISPSGEVSTLAGGFSGGYVDGDAAEARFNYPTGLALNSKEGVMYIAGFGNHKIRKITFNS